MKMYQAAPLVSLVAALLAATPAIAGGKNEQATAAIAAAQARIDAANKVGASGQVPQLQASAAAALRDAQNDLSHGHKDAAIAEANRASELADQALGEAQKAQAAQASVQQDQANAAATSAQADAAAASARAAAAEQAAASAAQDAAAARAAPPVVLVANPAPAPAPATTTVTTETTETPAMTPKKVVHHATRHRAGTATKNVHVKTTTTVAAQ